MCYFKIHLRRNLQARMASMTNSSELTKQIPDLMQTEQKEGRLVPAFFGYEAKWLRRQNRARGGRVGRVVGQAPPRARVESASGGPWRASCVSAVLQNTFYQVQRPGQSGGVRRPKVTTHVGLADTSLRCTAPPSGRRQTGPQARQSTRFTDAAGGARGSAAHDWGPGTRVPCHRIPEPEPRARGAAGARALRYLLVDDGDVPRNPLSQAALRQDRAAGDRAPRLELALLPQVLELAGALAEGEEVLCGGARAVRPRLGSGWRLPRYGHPSGPASGTLRCLAGLLCSSQSSRCCPPCPGPRVCWGDGGRRQAPCGMPRAWESGRGGQPRALMAPDTFQGSPRIQAKGTPGCGCILDKRK